MSPTSTSSSGCATGNTQQYRVFGGVLCSDLPLPDLPLTDAQVLSSDWTFRVSADPPPAVVLDPIGEYLCRGIGLYQLYRTSSGLRLVFSQRYIFDISEGGTEIVWYRVPENLEEYVRALLLGYVLAIANGMAGVTCLHGSAVAVQGQGIAFLGSKYHGKSTLGLALTLAGARFLTDDTVAVDLEPRVLVRPGVHSVRLWNDSAVALEAGNLGLALVDGVKHTLTRFPGSLLQTSPVPLAAVYILDSVPADRSYAAVAASPLPRRDAAIMMIANMKPPPPLMGSAQAGVLMQRAATLARTVPIRRLRIARDFERLPEVVSTVLGWHGQPLHQEVAVG